MRLIDRWEDSQKLVENGRLIWYSGAKNPGLWNDHWRAENAEGLLESARKSQYPDRDIFLKYLDRDSPVLDGGCGVGHVVLGLKSDGYDSLGVENSEEQVRFVKSLAPDCDIETGDILALDQFPDGHFGGYISWGVVEHSLEGPKDALLEANRVLKIGATLLVSVPYFNPWRRLKARWALYPKPDVRPDPSQFYQMAFTKSEFISILKDCGFSLDYIDYSHAFAGMTREFGPVGRWVGRNNLIARVLVRAELIGPLRHLFGHTCFYVARKTRSAAETH